MVRPPDPARVLTTPAAPARWATSLVAAQIIAVEVDFGLLGISRFPIWALTCMAPIVLVSLRWPDLPAALWRRPQRAATAWLTWGVFSVAWSISPVDSARTVLVTLGIWTTTMWFVSTYGFDRWARTYLATMSVFLFAGLIHDVVMVLDAEAVHRFTGYGLEATDVARLALVTVVLAAGRMIESGRRDWICSVALGIGLVTLVASGTRTTMIALVICALALCLRTIGIGRTLLAGAVLASTLAVAFSLIPDPSEFVTREEGAKDIGSINGRINIWRAAWSATLDRPLTGNGWSSGEVVLPLASQRGELPVLVRHAHDIVLELTMSQGFVGLALFAIMIGSLVASRRNTQHQLAGLAVLGIIIAGATEAVVSRPTAMFIVLAAVLTERSSVHDRSP